VKTKSEDSERSASTQDGGEQSVQLLDVSESSEIKSDSSLNSDVNPVPPRDQAQVS
jgi:hypothetical protein